VISRTPTRCAVFSAATLVWFGFADAEPLLSDEKTWPQPLQPYVALVSAAQQYTRDRFEWRVLHEETFDEGQARTWRIDPGERALETEARTDEDGRGVVIFRGLGRAPGWIAVGEPVSGDLRLELTAKAMSVRPCDMSLFLGRLGDGPAFQFGGYDNTRNLLWLMPAGTHSTHGRGAVQVDASAHKLIERNRWHTVVLEIVDRQIAGYVDHELLGRALIGDRYNPDELLQPHVYLYGSTLAIDQVTIRQRHRSQDWNDQEQFALAFGEMTREQLDARIRTLAGMLGDDAWPVRDGAQRLLMQLGDLAVQPLRDAALAPSASPELRHRAERVLRYSGVTLDLPAESE
jgi:hypothetical protein